MAVLSTTWSSWDTHRAPSTTIAAQMPGWESYSHRNSRLHQQGFVSNCKREAEGVSCACRTSIPLRARYVTLLHHGHGRTILLALINPSPYFHISLSLSAARNDDKPTARGAPMQRIVLASLAFCFPRQKACREDRAPSLRLEQHR